MTTTTRMQSFTCPNCDSTIGDMPLDGSYLKIGNAIFRHDLEPMCDHCGQVTTWHAPRPAVVSGGRRNRPRKKHAAPPLLVLVELAA